MAHHRHPQLPADNNVAENVIKQLGKKLRLMEGFSSFASAERCTRLLVGCYRFKRFTDSRRNGGNGHSPLELAGAQPRSRLARLPPHPTPAATLNLTLANLTGPEYPQRLVGGVSPLWVDAFGQRSELSGR
jgi:hypothetical protein